VAKRTKKQIMPSNPDELRAWYLGDGLGLKETENVPGTADMKEEKKESRPGDIHAGHRERLRDRFIQNKGFETFQDHEILELLLFYAHARGDTNGLAHELLNAFGSLKAVLEARPEQLMTVKGIGKEAAVLITMAVPLTKVWHRCALTLPDRIGNSRDAEHFCLSLLAGERTERFYVVSLNAQCNVLGQRKISEGSLTEVSAYPRMVMETALNYNAHSVLLCHNHPGGTCAPSVEDVTSTLQLQHLLASVGILLLDHIIVAGERTYSMVQHGDIDYRIRTRSANR
jgi:DNA repair protein RadC